MLDKRKHFFDRKKRGKERGKLLVKNCCLERCEVYRADMTRFIIFGTLLPVQFAAGISG